MMSRWAAVVFVTTLFLCASIPLEASPTTELISLPHETVIAGDNTVVNETSQWLCFLRISGRIPNLDSGHFFGIPIPNHPRYGFCHLGFGSFTINHSTIGHLKVTLFIGYYQPTGSLGEGVLSGFALRATTFN